MRSIIFPDGRRLVADQMTGYNPSGSNVVFYDSGGQSYTYAAGSMAEAQLVAGLVDVFLKAGTPPQMALPVPSAPVGVSVISISPNSYVHTDTNFNFTVTGTGFEPGSPLWVNAFDYAFGPGNATWVSATTITVAGTGSGASAGTYDVTVVNSDGTTGTLPGGSTLT